MLSGSPLFLSADTLTGIAGVFVFVSGECMFVCVLFFFFSEIYFFVCVCVCVYVVGCLLGGCRHCDIHHVHVCCVFAMFSASN